VRPENLQYVKLSEIKGWTTNLDVQETPEDIALTLIGGRLQRRGMIFERDRGTVYKFPTPPLLPAHTSDRKEITSIEILNTEYYAKLTVPYHGFSTGKIIYITGAPSLPNGDINGTWEVVAIDGNSFYIK